VGTGEMPPYGTPEYNAWAEENPWPAWLKTVGRSGYAPGSAFQQYLENQYQNMYNNWQLGNRLSQAGGGTATPWGAYQPDWGYRTTRSNWNALTALSPENVQRQYYTDLSGTGGSGDAYLAALNTLRSGGLGGGFLNWLQNRYSKTLGQYQGSGYNGDWLSYLQNMYGI